MTVHFCDSKLCFGTRSADARNAFRGRLGKASLAPFEHVPPPLSQELAESGERCGEADAAPTQEDVETQAQKMKAFFSKQEQAMRLAS